MSNVKRRRVPGLGILSIGHNANARATSARINNTSGQLLIKSPRLGCDRLCRRLPAIPKHHTIADGGSMSDLFLGARELAANKVNCGARGRPPNLDRAVPPGRKPSRFRTSDRLAGFRHFAALIATDRRLYVDRK